MKYKSPGDSLDIDVFYKAQAYASLYKSYGTTVNGISAEDVTVTLLRESKPAGLLRYLQEHDCKVSNPWPGLYYNPPSMRNQRISNVFRISRV